MIRKKTTRWYLKIFAFLVITVAAILLPWACQEVQDSPTHYYLTTNNQLLEYSYLSTRIYHQKGKVGKIDPGFFYPDTPLEKDQYLYVTAFYRNGEVPGGKILGQVDAGLSRFGVSILSWLYQQLPIFSYHLPITYDALRLDSP